MSAVRFFDDTEVGGWRLGLLLASGSKYARLAVIDAGGVVRVVRVPQEDEVGFVFLDTENSPEVARKMLGMRPTKTAEVELKRYLERGEQSHD